MTRRQPMCLGMNSTPRTVLILAAQGVGPPRSRSASDASSGVFSPTTIETENLTRRAIRSRGDSNVRSRRRRYTPNDRRDVFVPPQRTEMGRAPLGGVVHDVREESGPQQRRRVGVASTTIGSDHHPTSRPIGWTGAERVDDATGPRSVSTAVRQGTLGTTLPNLGDWTTSGGFYFASPDPLATFHDAIVAPGAPTESECHRRGVTARTNGQPSDGSPAVSGGRRDHARAT